MPKLTNLGSSNRSLKSIRDMGKFLRKARLRRGHTLKDVGAALGRKISFVCDVEHGRRGHRMDPITALLWAEYLVVDPQELFSYLGFGDTELDRFRVQQYLQSSAWAHRFTVGRRTLQNALPEIEALWSSLKSGTPQKAQAFQVREAIQIALESLRVPRKGRIPDDIDAATSQ